MRSLSRDATDNPGNLDEQALIQGIRTGDISAFNTMYLHYHPRLLEFAYRYLPSQEAAEDVVQETMLAIWRGRERWFVTHSLTVYLYGAVRNRALQVARHEGIVHRTEQSGILLHQPIIGNIPLPDEAFENRDRHRALQRAIATLSNAQQRILLLRWRDELTTSQIGIILGISHAAAKKQVQRAENAIKTLLEIYRQ